MTAALVEDTVKDCDTCPFAFKTHRWHCTHTSNDGGSRALGRSDMQMESEPPPEWCPLRLGPVLVKLVLPDGER